MAASVEAVEAWAVYDDMLEVARMGPVGAGVAVSFQDLAGPVTFSD
jgi:hypothetical protein